MIKDFFDIHSHMLPNIDDGSESMEQTASMLDLAYAEGIRSVIFTPHFGHYFETSNAVVATCAFRAVEEAFASRFDDFSWHLGHEILYDSLSIPALIDGRALTLAGTDYVLIEFYLHEPFSVINGAVSNLLSAGYRPVIAHAERYYDFRKHPDHVAKIVRRGALIQINSSVLEHNFMNANYRLVRKWLRDDLVHFVGTDSHGDVLRKPLMKDAADKICSIVTLDAAERILCENGRRLLDNMPII